MPKVVSAKKQPKGTPDGVLATAPSRNKPYPLPYMAGKKRTRGGAAANYPPPPPPPPPPANNPYYQKFFEDYWRKYSKGFQVPGGVPGVLPGNLNYGLGVLPPPAPGVPNLPPLVLPPPPPEVPATRTGALSAEEYPVKRDKPTYVLAAPDDLAFLSEKQCYVRTRLCELFIAQESDVEKGVRHRRAAFVGQVGLRCVYCVPAMDPKDRVERAITYPTSAAKFYQTAQDMQHFHFAYCPAMPPKVRGVYQSLRTSMNHRRGEEGKASPKEYWTRCCEDWGLVDRVGEDGKKCGVALGEGHTLVERARLPEYKKELFMPPGEGNGKAGVAEEEGTMDVEEGGDDEGADGESV